MNKLIASSKVITSFKDKTFRVFEEDGFTEEASKLSILLVLTLVFIGSIVEVGLF